MKLDPPEKGWRESVESSFAFQGISRSSIGLRECLRVYFVNATCLGDVSKARLEMCIRKRVLIGTLGAYAAGLARDGPLKYHIRNKCSLRVFDRDGYRLID